MLCLNIKKKVEAGDSHLVDERVRDEMRAEMSTRIGELKRQWAELEATMREKAERLFDANRGLLFEQSVDSIEIWIKEMEKHIRYTVPSTSAATSADAQDGSGGEQATGGEQGGSEQVSPIANTDLTTTNLLLDKQREIEAQLTARRKQVDELREQAELLKKSEPERAALIDAKRERLETDFAHIIEPLEERRRALLEQKRICQFLRDCDDERLWISEKRAQADSRHTGDSLVRVHMLTRKCETLARECDNHEQLIEQCIAHGRQLIDEGQARSAEFEARIDELRDEWRQLREAIEARKQLLADAQRVHQYLADCDEAEAWMGEQELYMMSDASSAHALLLLQQQQQQALPLQQQQQQQQAG